MGQTPGFNPGVPTHGFNPWVRPMDSTHWFDSRALPQGQNNAETRSADSAFLPFPLDTASAASLAALDPSMKEFMKGGGRRRRAARFTHGFVAVKEAVDEARSHADVLGLSPKA